MQKETPREINTPATIKEGLIVPEAAEPDTEEEVLMEEEEKEETFNLLDEETKKFCLMLPTNDMH